MPTFPSDPDETPPYARTFRNVAPAPTPAEIVCTGFRTYSDRESDYLCQLMQQVTIEVYPPGRQRRFRNEPSSK